MAKCPWCGKDMLAYVFSRGWAARCPNVDCPEKVYHATPDKALAAASKRFMPKMTVEEILEPREKFSILFTEALNSFPDKKQGECPNVFSARYASFVNYVLAVQATRIADFISGAE